MTNNSSEISIFLPVRSGSSRVINKNTRPFLSNGKSLFEHKIEQLLSIRDYVKEIVVSTNDPNIIKHLEKYSDDKLFLDLRPDHLCTSNTKVSDLINYVPSVISSDHILWLHVTSPFVTPEDYLSAIQSYKNEVVIKQNYDSIMSVNKIQQFIWDDNLKKFINCNREINPWPNTQDLQPLYEINHAFYISSRSNYIKLNDRIGTNPYLFICSGNQKIDIDWEDDFNLACQVANGKS